jgi:hypothetical protein
MSTISNEDLAKKIKEKLYGLSAAKFVSQEEFGSPLVSVEKKNDAGDITVMVSCIGGDSNKSADFDVEATVINSMKDLDMLTGFIALEIVNDYISSVKK